MKYICKLCGKAMVRYKTRTYDSGMVVRYYRCSDKDCKNRASKISHKETVAL
jgi:hypothetical protein